VPEDTFVKRYKGKQKYLDPEVVRMISNMELKARLVVEGFISGLHKSPYQGFSVEFAEHREYVPGDELKHIDSVSYTHLTLPTSDLV